MNSISCTFRNKIILAVGCVFVAIIKSTCNSNVKKMMKDTVLLVKNIKLQLESIKEQQDVMSEAIKKVSVKLQEQENSQSSIQSYDNSNFTNKEQEKEITRDNISSIKNLILEINSALLETNKKQKDIIDNISLVKSVINDTNLTLSKHENKQNNINTKICDTECLVNELKNNAEKLPEMVKSVLKEYFLHLHDDHKQMYELLSNEK